MPVPSDYNNTMLQNWSFKDFSLIPDPDFFPADYESRAEQVYQRSESLHRRVTLIQFQFPPSSIVLEIFRLKFLLIRKC